MNGLHISLICAVEIGVLISCPEEFLAYGQHHLSLNLGAFRGLYRLCHKEKSTHWSFSKILAAWSSNAYISISFLLRSRNSNLLPTLLRQKNVLLPFSLNHLMDYFLKKLYCYEKCVTGVEWKQQGVRMGCADHRLQKQRPECAGIV